METRGRASLQPPDRKAALPEKVRQFEARTFAKAPGRPGLFTQMNQAAQKGAGGHDNRTAGESIVRGLDSLNAAVIDNQPGGLAAQNRQIGRRRQFRLHGLAILRSVDLGAWSTYGWTLGAIQQAILDRGAVGHTSHDAVKCVDLANQMPLSQTADGRVTGHHAYGFGILGQQRCADSHARGCGRSFTACMAAADDDHVKSLRIRYLHLEPR